MSFNPQTPQSPSNLSLSTADQSSSLNSSMTSITTALPTPANSISGSHQAADMSHDGSPGGDSPQKRKRSFDDSGDQSQKKVHLEDPRKLGIGDLHLDVGEKYLLCRTQPSVSLPRTSEDLFEMFNMTGIAAEVARTLPNGEKNALRKTYKGHIKKLGVNGHFDAVKRDPMAEDSLMAMVSQPDLEWHVHHVSNKDVSGGLSDSTQSNLIKAMTMAKGPIPKALWDSSVLGDLAPGNVGKKGNTAQATAPSTPADSAQASKAALLKAQGQQPDRSRRNIKKRSYQDSSFEGYRETFDDEGGYSTGDGDDRGSLKRRKQNPGTSVPPTRQPSFNSALAGVRS